MCYKFGASLVRIISARKKCQVVCWNEKKMAWISEDHVGKEWHFIFIRKIRYEWGPTPFKKSVIIVYLLPLSFLSPSFFISHAISVYFISFSFLISSMWRIPFVSLLITPAINMVSTIIAVYCLPLSFLSSSFFISHAMSIPFFSASYNWSLFPSSLSFLLPFLFLICNLHFLPLSPIALPLICFVKDKSYSCHILCLSSAAAPWCWTT